MNATTLRYILIACLLLVLGAMAAGFYFVHGQLQTFAEDVAKTQSEAKTADTRLNQLVQLERDLEQYASTVTKSKQIVAESQMYQYQNQVIEDLTAYASRANVSITSFVFQAAENNAPESTTTPEATAEDTATSSDEETSTQPAPETPSVRNTLVSVQLQTPVPYTNLLHFLHLIEENLTRMQITEISLNKGDSADVVNTETLNIEVYIR